MRNQVRVTAAHRDTVIHLAGVAIAVGFYRALSARLRPFDEVFHEGREVGYNRGYWEGRREGKPVVVPMACPDCGRANGRTRGASAVQ